VIARRDAKARRREFVVDNEKPSRFKIAFFETCHANERGISEVLKIMLLEIVNRKLNIESTVQDCDATMFNRSY
jgi:hypothetical protein